VNKSKVLAVNHIRLHHWTQVSKHSSQLLVSGAISNIAYEQLLCGLASSLISVASH